MENPFTQIPSESGPAVVEKWLAAGLIDNKPCGFDLISYQDEWADYPIGKIKQLAEIAEIILLLTEPNLNDLLKSPTVCERMESSWIKSVSTLDEVYLGLLLDYLQKTQQVGGGDS